MAKLEKMLYSVHKLGNGSDSGVSASAILAVTIIYLIAVLSVPLYSPQYLVWLAVYPMVQSEISGIGFGTLFIKSLWVLPLILLIGLFNPLLDTQTLFHVGGIAVSRGWVSFFSLSLRGLLAVQAALLLTLTAGFYDMCHSLRHFGCPKILVYQLQFTYRYLIVILEEALGMEHARKSRGFGRKNYPLSMWARLIGQLLIRSYDRASSIHRAMLARGFSGTMPSTRSHAMNFQSWCFIGVWSGLIVLLRFVNLGKFFVPLFNS